MTQEVLNQIAVNVVAGFLALYNMIPSVDGLEVHDYNGGEHTVWTVQSRAPDETADDLDTDEMYKTLTAYLENHNAAATAVRFHPYNIEAYVCPCGCGSFYYISVYQ